jgi:cytolysin-activating lysine-acyltransferase
VVVGAVGVSASYTSALGAICSVMMRSPTYCQYPIACIYEWIRPAILHRQYHLFNDPGGNVIGYMTWALLAEDSESRLINDPQVLLHLSEWNEGDRLWIMDFAVLNGDVKYCVNIARSRLSVYRSGQWLRRRDDGTVRKAMRLSAI